jgi:Na+/H+-dicarboxylate symporter
MLAGAELGVDAPQIAAQSHFLADIFLRLIRMIVAPLITGGIVTGIAGVPRATLVVLLAVAGSFQIPATAVLMLLGVDTLMDMGRTALNVIGNCMAAAVVARWEGELKLTANAPAR